MRDGTYGLTMYPGYLGYAYRSPILVDNVTPHGGRQFELEFVNIFYAAGVQQMAYELRVLRREASYLVAEVMHQDRSSDRTVVIEEMSPDWIKENVHRRIPQAQRMFDEAGRPIRTAFLELCSSVY